MVTYPINFPTSTTVNGLRLLQRNAISSTKSPYTYSDKVYNNLGEAWQIEGSLPVLAQTQGREYMAFISKLKGKYGTFLFTLPSSIATAQGSWAGTPVVNGASQTGNTLDIRGLTPNTNNIGVAGDFINLGTGSSTRLYMLLEDVNSDGSGNATLTLWPSLRTSPADGASVINSGVKILLRLSGDTPIDIDVNRHYFLQFSAEEAL